MELKVQMKQTGKKSNSIVTTGLYLKNTPSTIEELLIMTVKATLAGFKKKALNEEAILISTEQIDDMASSGKVSFGFIEGNKNIDEKDAIKTVIEAFEDGLVALFIDDIRFEDLKEHINLTGNETLTFVKLTMLAGRMW